MGPFILRVWHTGKAKISLPISDLGAFKLPDGKQAPAYITLVGVTELVFAGEVAASFHYGSLRKYIDNGFLSYEFAVTEEMGLAVATAITEAGSGLPAESHAASHEAGGGDPLVVQQLSSGTAANGQRLETRDGGLVLRAAGVDYRSKQVLRDAQGRVSAVVYDGVDTWTLTRDSEGRVAEITNGLVTKTIVRDGGGNVEAVTVTEA